MRLICEAIEKVQFLKEADEKTGEKSYFIEGVFLQGNMENRNGRVYPMDLLEREVNRYVGEFVTKNRAYGELGHPTSPTINLDRVSHMIKELRREGNNFYGKAKITSTLPMGKIVVGLLDEGASLGVSSRGIGSLRDDRGVMQVQDDYRIATAADIVADPSAPDAFVRGIMENVEWIVDATSGCWIPAHNTLDRIAEEVKKEDKNIFVSSKKFEMFEQFINAISTHAKK